MRTEAEIRDAIDVLQGGLDSPCDCHATAHEAKCAMGAFAIKCMIDALLFTIGEPPRFAPKPLTLGIEEMRHWNDHKRG